METAPQGDTGEGRQGLNPGALAAQHIGLRST